MLTLTGTICFSSLPPNIASDPVYNKREMHFVHSILSFLHTNPPWASTTNLSTSQHQPEAVARRVYDGQAKLTTLLHGRETVFGCMSHQAELCHPRTNPDPSYSRTSGKRTMGCHVLCITLPSKPITLWTSRISEGKLLLRNWENSSQ